MNQKHYQATYHVNVNISLIVKNVIQIKKIILINVSVSAKI